MLTITQKKMIALFVSCVWNISHLQAMEQYCPISQNYPLQRACLEGNEKKVKDLINQGLSVNIKNVVIDLNNPGKFDIIPTPLHCAAEKGHSDIIKYLLDKKADIHSTHSLFNATPLHVAVWHHQPACVKILLERGAQPDSINGWGSTPVHLTTFGNSLPCLEELLKNNSQSVNYKLCTAKNNNGNTPIDFAKNLQFRDVFNKLQEIINSNNKD